MAEKARSSIKRKSQKKQKLRHGWDVVTTLARFRDSTVRTGVVTCGCRRSGRVLLTSPASSVQESRGLAEHIPHLRFDADKGKGYHFQDSA
jgi:hypothetical protein